MTDEKPLKSSFELAMERLKKVDADAGVEPRRLTDEQKASIAELRRFYEAKLAEQELLHQSALRKIPDPEARAALEEEYRARSRPPGRAAGREARKNPLRAILATPLTATNLRRDLGLWAVAGVVAGDMLGSGIFFTPGELAAVALAPWHVYLLWALAGGITLCGALTLAELASRWPRAGAPFHIIRESFGPFLAFATIWMQVWVAGPGSIAGVAVAFGEFVARTGPPFDRWSAPAWGAAAIAFFVAVNLLGVRWGGRTQIALTTAKVAGLLALVAGSLWLTDAGSQRLSSVDSRRRRGPHARSAISSAWSGWGSAPCSTRTTAGSTSPTSRAR